MSIFLEIFSDCFDLTAILTAYMEIFFIYFHFCEYFLLFFVNIPEFQGVKNSNLGIDFNQRY